ncbi:regulator of nonsense transcripts 3A-like [Bradysia coprophila]|uniref:regulator of nonsense transcripts 3A-like n=1 Tax=Bradysia coprophila TaxID=38358 RepID=UPI00187DC48E|nr:regulator of nonsense transcripts 3A-like [Bradysia coprophila]
MTSHESNISNSKEEKKRMKSLAKEEKRNNKLLKEEEKRRSKDEKKRSKEELKRKQKEEKELSKRNKNPPNMKVEIKKTKSEARSVKSEPRSTDKANVGASPFLKSRFVMPRGHKGYVFPVTPGPARYPVTSINYPIMKARRQKDLTKKMLNGPRPPAYTMGIKHSEIREFYNKIQ